MALRWIGLGGLAAELVEMTRPLLRRQPPARKHIDRALAEADSETRRRAAKAPPRPQVACGISVAQLARMDAEPAMTWDGSGFRCPAATHLVITGADGTEKHFRLPAGCRIPVSAGLLLLPPAEP